MWEAYLIKIVLTVSIILRVKYPDKDILSWVLGELVCASSCDPLASSTWMEQHLKEEPATGFHFTIPIPVMHSTGNQMRLLKTTTLEPLCRRGGPKTTERGRLDKHRTEQGPYDPSSGSRPASSRQRRSRLRPQRCGTDAGGLRHRQEKEDASSQWTITSITTHLTDLFPPPKKTFLSPFLLHHYLSDIWSIIDSWRMYRRWMHMTGLRTQG